MTGHTMHMPGEKTASEGQQHYWTSRLLVMYFILAFAITWTILIPALVLIPEDAQTPFFILAAFGPFLAAVLVIGIGKGWAELRNWLRGIFRLRIPVYLYLAGALLLPLVIGGLHYLLYRVLGGEPDLSAAEAWYLYLIYLLLTALFTGGNEEPGWRGFALPALLERFHPLIASLILGFMHAAWHLPLMGHYGTHFAWYLFNLIPLTILLNWMFLVSRNSVIPVMLLHASMNVISEFIPTPVDVLGGLGTQMVLRGMTYWIMSITIIILTKGRLGSAPRENNQ